MTPDPSTQDFKIVSAAHREAFVQRGIVKLSGFFSAEQMRQCRDLLHRSLEQAGVMAQGAWVGDRLVGDSGHRLHYQLLREHLKPLASQSVHFRILQSPDLQGAAEALAGGLPLKPLMDLAQLLFTPPNANEWEIPRGLWHVDLPRLEQAISPGVQVFAFIDRVEPGGGGTLSVAGSHRLLNDQGKLRSKEVKRRLSQDPWFKKLFARDDDDDPRLSLFSAATEQLEIIEMTGEPGDVYFMDLRCLHTLAPNASNRPRLMATQRYLLAHLDQSVFES